MIEERQPNLWSCYPTAIAICTGIPLADIVRAVGHDGSGEIAGIEPPWNKEAFVWSEMALAMPKLGWILACFNACCANSDGKIRTAWPKIDDLLNWVHARFDCVLCVAKGDRDHAVAWRKGDDIPIDPNPDPQNPEWDWSKWPIKEIDILYRMEGRR